VSSFLSPLLSTAVSLLIIIGGIFLLSLTLLLSCYAAAFEIVRLRWSGESPISATISFAVLIISISLIGASVALPIRIAMLDVSDRSFETGRGMWAVSVPWLQSAAPVIAVIAIVLGIIALVTLPYVLRALTWLHAAIELRRRHPGFAILLLSRYVEVAYAQEWLAAGTGVSAIC